MPPGQTVFLRWVDANNSGTDQGLGVDDLTVSFSASPSRLISLVFSNGITHLTGAGESNVIYGLEAATNLSAPFLWQRLGSNTANGSGVFQFTDTNAPAFPRRFYRALFP